MGRTPRRFFDWPFRRNVRGRPARNVAEKRPPETAGVFLRLAPLEKRAPGYPPRAVGIVSGDAL
jgi:hypothetical protein